MVFFKPIPKSRYEEIAECEFYRKRLAGNWHLCTLYGVAGNKSQPLYKRALSHIPMIVYFKVDDG